MPRFGDPELLRPEHVLAGFRSGETALDRWLRDRARTAAGAGSARTYVVVDAEQERVVGYHALTVASVEHEHATARARKGMPLHPIPVVLLARLAVDESVQGRGIGAFLLRDAMTRTAAAAGRFGIRALLVHALHDDAQAFYVRHGLEPSPTDQLHLMILVKDIRAAIEAVGDGRRDARRVDRRTPHAPRRTANARATTAGSEQHPDPRKGSDPGV